MSLPGVFASPSLTLVILVIGATILNTFNPFSAEGYVSPCAEAFLVKNRCK
jgi:hypothetical protein